MPIVPHASLSPSSMLLTHAPSPSSMLLNHAPFRAPFRALLLGLLAAMACRPGMARADEVPLDQIRQRFQQLSSAEFAVRERAASELTEMGVSVVPELRKLTEATTDPEVQLRAGGIIRQLTDGDAAGQIMAFIAGEHADFAGWRAIRGTLGDSVPIRELFVELMREHPDVLKSLEGTTRDRVMALDKTISSIQHKLQKLLESPSQADAFALLLPILDRQLPINNRFEPTALSVFRQEAATKIHNDAQLSIPFKTLLEQWIARSTKLNRGPVLEFAMLWDLEIAMPVAVQTLQEINSPETLTTALQAIARFGGREQIEFVVPLLEDRSVVVEQGFIRGKEVQTLLCDVAMVTIARLYNLELSALGYPKSADDPVFSFVKDEVGFGKDEAALRKANREKIDRLLDEKRQVPESSIPFK